MPRASEQPKTIGDVVSAARKRAKRWLERILREGERASGKTEIKAPRCDKQEK